MPLNNTISVVGQPQLVPGKRNELILQLDGEDDYLTLPYINLCLFNPNLCSYGITHSFTLSLLAFKENTYIFTTCGDKDTYNGFSFYYGSKELVFSVSTTTHVYKAKIVDIDQETYEQENEYQLTWSAKTGATVFMNGKILSKSFSVQRKMAMVKYNTCSLTIGRDAMDSKLFTKMKFGSWRIYFATRTALLKLGFFLGIYKSIFFIHLYFATFSQRSG